MASYCKVIMLGNLTADPELKYLPNGTAVCQFNVAVNRKWKDQSGQDKEEVAFIGVKAWNKQAELICQYLKKGRPIMLDGRLTQESWEKDGKRQSKTLVTLESFQFLDSNNATGATQQQTRTAPPPAQRTAPAAPPPSQEDDDSSDVPF